MSEDEGSQERTLDPTEKRRKEARKEGQIPRSKELSKTTLLILAATMLWMTGGKIVTAFINLMKETFTFSYHDLYDFSDNLAEINRLILELLFSLLPFFISLFLGAIISSILTGGWIFSSKVLMFKASRLNPISGLGKMFSLISAVELIKAIAKVLLVLTGGVLILYLKFDAILFLNRMPIISALMQGNYLLSYTFIILTSTLIVIVGIDVPFQLWQSAKKLKMTRQEMKEESKESEGSPEVKRHIRQMQHKISQNRMMSDVPKADVIITNPTHYAVALRYDQMRSAAPRVVAKGGGVIAEQIRKVGLENKVTIISAPPLARAIFFSTEIGREIPGSLYVAVAKVLAYVYQLKNLDLLKGERLEPLNVDDLPIPDELRY